MWVKATVVGFKVSACHFREWTSQTEYLQNTSHNQQAFPNCWVAILSQVKSRCYYNRVTVGSKFVYLVSCKLLVCLFTLLELLYSDKWVTVELLLPTSVIRIIN